MIVAHAVHYLVAAPAALVLAAIALATFLEGRRSRGRGVAVPRDGEPAPRDQPEAAGAARRDRSSDGASVS